MVYKDPFVLHHTCLFIHAMPANRKIAATSNISLVCGMATKNIELMPCAIRVPSVSTKPVTNAHTEAGIF